MEQLLVAAEVEAAQARVLASLPLPEWAQVWMLAQAASPRVGSQAPLPAEKWAGYSDLPLAGLRYCRSRTSTCILPQQD